MKSGQGRGRNAARFLIATFNETQSFRFGYKRYEIFPFRIWPRRKDEKENEFQKLSARPIWSILGGVGGIGGVGGLAGTFLNLFVYPNDIHWRKSELFRYF